MGISNEIYVDREHGAVVINDAGVPMRSLLPALRQHPEIAALVQWTSTTMPAASTETRHGGLFDRDRYVSPVNPYDQMRVAYDAAESDDVVGSALDSTEALAFGRMEIECDDPDEQDVWNQIAEDIDLDSRMREIWREQFITSNSYAFAWTDRKSYKVRGKSKAADGVARKRKKVFEDLVVPTGISVLDPLRVLPVGGFLFNRERFCYIADWTERDVIDSWLLGGDASGVDPIVQQLVIGKFVPDLRDRRQVGNLGVDPNRLYMMDPTKVWRMTPTRSQYQRFATVRLKSVFEILDLKHQLRQMDRAYLIGATNFILLVKKGSKDKPAQQPEIDALSDSMRRMSRIPVIIGDERLSIEIVTPKTDQTLNAEKYAGLDIRISGRLYGLFITSRSRGDDSVKIAKLVSRGLENKRDQQRRAIMRQVFNPCYQRNDAFTSPPALMFYPKRIALDFDPALATYLLDLRDRRDLSRDTVLSEVDHDEAVEARKMEYEAKVYDHIFQSQVPFSSPNLAPGGGGGAGGPGQPKPGLPSGTPPQVPGRTGGRAGGNRNGGGAAPGSGQGQPPRSGRPDERRNRARADLEDDDGGAGGAPKPPSQRTRAHAAAAAALRERRSAQEAAVEDAVADAVAELAASHQEEIAELQAQLDAASGAGYADDEPMGEEE